MALKNVNGLCIYQVAKQLDEARTGGRLRDEETEACGGGVVQGGIKAVYAVINFRSLGTTDLRASLFKLH